MTDWLWIVFFVSRRTRNPQGLQVLRPRPELLRYYEAVWDSPYTLNRTDLLMGWPHEQVCVAATPSST